MLTISSTGIFSVDCPLPATASSSSNSSSNQQQPAAATAPAPSRPLHIRLSVAITVDATRLRRCNRRFRSRVVAALEVGLEVHCPSNIYFLLISTNIERLARLPLFHRPPPFSIWLSSRSSSSRSPSTRRVALLQQRRRCGGAFVVTVVIVESHFPPSFIFLGYYSKFRVSCQATASPSASRPDRPPPIPFGCQVERLRRVLRLRVASLFGSGVGVGAELASSPW